MQLMLSKLASLLPMIHLCKGQHGPSSWGPHSHSCLAVRFTAKNGRHPGEWGWTNLGELNFHYENGSPRTKMHLNSCQYMPRVQELSTELRIVHFSGRGNCYLKVIHQIYPKWSKYIQVISILLVFVTK